MRLVERKGIDKFSLTKDLVGEIPPYAILSHTWGDDDQEVNFKDFARGSEKSKFGYRKIEFCGEQAALDGYRYIWVDTCSIDKSNNAELSEALNSMYRWYKNAAKCYVYLADVSTNNQNLTGGLSPSAAKAFRKSRWFTRGWTLQELIAPQTVEFFSFEGNFLGNKKSLEKEIREITGIPVLALRGMPLSEFTFKERFSWAEKRETKKEEDKAYSLLGIFDVFLPLIYGEGQENAFRRLREEFDKINTSKNPESNNPSTFRAGKPPKIVGREDTMQEMTNKPKTQRRPTSMGNSPRYEKHKNDEKGLEGRQPVVICYKCSRFGHYANDPRYHKRVEYGHRANNYYCNKCNKYGHDNDDDHCYKCNKYGHYASALHCHKCKSIDHFVKDCPR